MKLLYLFVSLLLTISVNAGRIAGPTGVVANAGPDQTIYLTQTSSVTLNGSASSAGSYQWTEVSTDYSSGATITSPNSAVTTVTGLKQGVWYFQLSVTSNGITATDEVVVRVDYDLPPSNGTLIEGLPIADIASNVNNRSDTTNYIGYTFPNSFSTSFGHTIYLERSRLPAMTIDNYQGKFISTLEDGYQWNNSGYARSECTYGTGFPVDSNKTYMLEWKGYFPQSNFYLDQSGASWASAVVMMQIHANNSAPPPFGLNLGYNGNIYVSETPTGASNPDSLTIAQYSDFFNKTHTIRVIFKEGKGYSGQDAFIKIEIDGVQKYYRNSGGVGATWQQDYLKFGSLYDYGKRIVDPFNFTRNRKFSLVTESYNVYEINGNVTNKAPTADAGSDQTITLPNNTVTLSGSGQDTDGSISSYKWSEISGPTANISDPNSASTDVTGLTEGTYEFKLTVTDNKGATGTSTVTVTVKAASNIPPTADAGSDQTITLPVDSVTLSGSANDSDGSISSYKWSEVSGSTANFSDPNSVSTNVTNLVAGTYQFKLTVTDDKGATATSTVTVTVKEAPNNPPTADAGSDQTITLPTNTVTLTGSGKDTDGSISSYKWSQISGTTANFSNLNSASTDVTDLQTGTYQFQLTVADDKGATANDTVSVTVKKSNLSPIANAGSDQVITLPTNSITLSGSASDSDGTVASYNWTEKNGPQNAKINSPSSANTTVDGLTEGDYTFELSVTDNQGATGSDTIHVRVNPPLNATPTANAGNNKTIVLPVDSVTLKGEGQDTDGTVASYLWTKISGPAGIKIYNSAATNTVVSGLVQGIYQFELQVTDNEGAIGKDTVRVTVNAPNNISPTANAGADQTITLPANSVSLSGSGNDSDGRIKSYSWTKFSGPAGAQIANSDSAYTSVTNLVKGVYQFELTVTDDKGDSGTDTIVVKVNSAQNQPPVAHTGNDQTITLPTNTITLSGSGTDADGTITSYKWTQKNGPAGVNIKDSSSATTVVNGLIQGDYTFELTVKDDLGASGIDTVHVKVNPAQNDPPVVDAGNDQTITLPTDSITLSGSGTDSDGKIASYKWIQSSGPSSANISKSTAASTEVTGLKEGVYIFKLTVIDDMGAEATSSTEITVKAAVSNNVAPTANAGADQSITLPSNSIMLSGNGSDTDGSITNYDWKKISGPTEFSIANSSSQVANVTGLVEGEYVFELTVTDNEGAKGTSTVTVTVKAVNNIPPTANAGADQSVTLPLNSATLRGEGNDVDGTVVGYSWNQISGPSSGTINNPNSSSTVVSNLVEGIYVFELQVKDDRGGIGKDTLAINVNSNNSASNNNTSNNTTSGNESTSNSLPVANAGNDSTLIAPVQFVTLNGSAIDNDGNITGYSWRQISGPSASSIMSSRSATTDISGLSEGTYSFELSVTDNKGGIGKDTVNITVALARYAPSKVKVVNIYPNPVHDIATLEVNTGSPNTNIGIVITDMSGRTVYKEEFVSSSTTTSKQINMSNLIKGTYIVTVYFDGSIAQSVKVQRL